MSGARGSYGQHMHVYIYIHINIASSTHPACRDGHMLLTAAVNEDAIVIAHLSLSFLNVALPCCGALSIMIMARADAGRSCFIRFRLSSIPRNSKYSPRSAAVHICEWLLWRVDICKVFFSSSFMLSTTFSDLTVHEKRTQSRVGLMIFYLH